MVPSLKTMDCKCGYPDGLRVRDFCMIVRKAWIHKIKLERLHIHTKPVFRLDLKVHRNENQNWPGVLLLNLLLLLLPCPSYWSLLLTTTPVTDGLTPKQKAKPFLMSILKVRGATFLLVLLIFSSLCKENLDHLSDTEKQNGSKRNFFFYHLSSLPSVFFFFFLSWGSFHK